MHNKICNNGKVSKCLFILLFCFLFTSCKDKKEIVFGLDKYEQASVSDFTCSYAITEWNGNPNYYYKIFDGLGDISFGFSINKDNSFIKGLKDYYGYFDVIFVFELNNIKDTLWRGFLASPRLENDNVIYPLGIESSRNPEVVSFKEIKDENEKIKAFKDILENCSIYAINPSNEKMRIKFTRDTEVIMRRLDIE